jgi:hypothetical protein
LGPLGGSWGHLGASWGCLGGILERLGVSWEYLGAFWRHLGDLLGAAWRVFGASWGVLGASWEHLGASWGVLERLGRLGGISGISWGHLGASWGILGRLGEAFEGSYQAVLLSTLGSKIKFFVMGPAATVDPIELFDLIVWNDLDEVQPMNLDTALSQGERPDLKGCRPVPPAPCRDRKDWCTDWFAKSNLRKFSK